MRVVGLILAWVVSLLALCAAGLIAFMLASNPNLTWLIAAIATAVTFALLANPLSSQALGLKGRWGRTAAMQMVLVGAGAAALFLSLSQMSSGPRAAQTAALTPAERGEQAYNEHRYEEALPLLRQAAEDGDAHAQYLLGNMYLLGNGGERNPSEGRRWFEAAAAQGHAGGQAGLGLYFESDEFGAQDIEQAARWYELASSQGVARAQLRLGYLYYDGRGVRQDKARALALWSAAGEGGEGRAAYNVGVMYRDGDGAAADPQQAVSWFERAAAAGVSDAALNLGEMYRLGDHVPRDREAALRWLTRAAEAENADAQFSLFVMLSLDGSAGECAQGREWLRRARENRQAEALEWEIENAC